MISRQHIIWKFWLRRNLSGRVADSVVGELQRICLMILQKSTKQILKKITISARLESNGFDAIGLNSGTSTSSSPKSTQRSMLSRVLGAIFSIEAFPPRTKLKPLRKNSILAWSVGHSLKKPTHHHCSGVVTTISSSATYSMLCLQQRKTRSHGD